MSIAIVGVGETDYAWKDPRPPVGAGGRRRAAARSPTPASPVPTSTASSPSPTRSPTRRPPISSAARIGVRDRAFTAHVGIAGSGTGRRHGAGAHGDRVRRGLRRRQLLRHQPQRPGRRRRLRASMPATAPRRRSRCRSATTASRSTSPPRQPGTATSSASSRSSSGPSPWPLGPTPSGRRTRCAGSRSTIDGYLASPLVAEPLAQARLLPGQRRWRGLRDDEPRAGPRPPPPPRPSSPASASDPSRSRSPATSARAATCSRRRPRSSGPQAYREAGLTPADVDVAEIYDCFTISMLLQLEDLGFAEKGAGAQFAASGRDRPGREPAGQHPRRPARPVVPRRWQPRRRGGAPAPRRPR